MSDAQQKPVEQSRRSVFAERLRTRIWQDEADPENPWHARAARIHGYRLDELIAGCDYPSLIFLLLRGELPEPEQAELMRRMLVAFCDPGPRHDAVRATMNAAATGTRAQSLLPIGLSVLGGDWLGSGEVEDSARFIARHLRQPATEVARSLLEQSAPATTEHEDLRVAPGFGSYFGSPDPYPAWVLLSIAGDEHAGGAIGWVLALHEALLDGDAGCLMPAVMAAVCLELGFPARSAGMLYQLASTPGIAAHALEIRGKGPQAVPFVDDENYTILSPREPA